MIWKGLPPVVELSREVYAKGVSLTKKAMREVEARLLRNPELPKWDILIEPLRSVSMKAEIALDLVDLMGESTASEMCPAVKRLWLGSPDAPEGVVAS
jgi:hypothetical protein